MRQISCEHIPAIDYGAGHRYSIFENNIACARWLREEWARALTQAQTGAQAKAQAAAGPGPTAAGQGQTSVH
jgi:hypothetical protein